MAGARCPPCRSLSRKTRRGIMPPVSLERTSSTTTRARATRHARGPRCLLKRTLPVAPGSSTRTPLPSSTGPTGPTRREGEQRDPEDSPFSAPYLSLSLVYPTPSPWPIKGKGRPLEGDSRHSPTRTDTSSPETWEPFPSLDHL
jgi:hypothetical protein